MRAVQVLKAYRCEWNVLTVVTRELCGNIREVYNFYRRNQFAFQQYIPCIDPFGEPRGMRPWSLTPSCYEQFLKNLFDCWYQDVVRGRTQYNRFFDNLLLIMAGRVPEACELRKGCGRQYAVEANGSVFPCHFYMLDQWRIGNLISDTMEEIEWKREQSGFLQMGAVPHEDCQLCRWYWLCRGGCRRDRDCFGDRRILSRNYFCSAYNHFFEYAFPKLQKLLLGI